MLNTGSSAKNKSLIQLCLTCNNTFINVPTKPQGKRKTNGN